MAPQSHRYDATLTADGDGRSLAGLPVAALVGRDGLCQQLDQFLSAVRTGQSGSLVVRGEPGIGKTALLEYLAARAQGGRVERITGVQSELELAYAGLQQLCQPMLDHLEAIPAPQRAALRTALGLSAGPVPDRFLVGLAVLSLLSDVAQDQPLLCLVDDAHWLDQASRQALGFALEDMHESFCNGLSSGQMAPLSLDVARDFLRRHASRI